MSGDWLKFDVTLPEKPEVWQIAGLLGIDPDAVVGKLMKVWRWFDQHTEDGNARSVTYALVDSLVGVTGFAEAMALCGWLEQDGSFLRIPNFDRNNGKTAKKRALTAKRVAECKSKSNATGNALSVTTALPREEKRREEEKQKKDAPAGADLFSGVSLEVIADFRRLRASKKAPITGTAIDGIKREAAKAGVTLEQALRTCCERGWTGFKAEWVAGQGGAPSKASLPGGGRREL
jgi:hypothetical protein